MMIDLNEKRSFLDEQNSNVNNIADNDIRFIQREIWGRVNKRRIIDYLARSGNADYQVVSNNINDLGISVFPYDFVKEYREKDFLIKKDFDCGYWYIDNYFGKKLYMHPKYKSEFRAARYFNNLRIEQDKHSPHAYLSDDFKPDENDVLIDIGGAEGIFAIQFVDVVKHIYIFECDEGWISALRKTFAGYEDKVTIIPKFVGNEDNDSMTTIDSFVKEYSLENEHLFVKMDVEGNELSVLLGANCILDNKNKFKLAICAYHCGNHEQCFRTVFEGCHIETAEGYMLYYYDYNIQEPFVRRGVLRISN